MSDSILVLQIKISWSKDIHIQILLGVAKSKLLWLLPSIDHSWKPRSGILKHQYKCPSLMRADVVRSCQMCLGEYLFPQKSLSSFLKMQPLKWFPSVDLPCLLLPFFSRSSLSSPSFLPLITPPSSSALYPYLSHMLLSLVFKAKIRWDWSHLVQFKLAERRNQSFFHAFSSL